MNDPGPIELPNGVRFGCDCKTCNETRDREIAADNERRKLGPLPPAPAVERHLVGLAHHPTIWEVAGPVVATLPTGERVELPAGTVLREGTLPPEPEDDRPTLGEQILADLTEHVDLPREMAPSVPSAPPNTVREEDDTGVRFVDRSQAMIDRNRRAGETWNITAHKSDLPDPPIGSGCLVYSCWTPCAPGHQHCARHGGADATLLHVKRTTRT